MDDDGWQLASRRDGTEALRKTRADRPARECKESNWAVDRIFQSAWQAVLRHRHC